ncbi:hypothetical protein RIR_jg27546.t1 [Rhizophagus irregularis DAOM 181602=DAOM 197198]|nr:hypothetical protein RIR_jg27546.t1 [Rhizophagus irregularis DAOM 181602=DAOM 197198]
MSHLFTNNHKQLSGQNPASSIFSLSGLLFIRPSLRSLFFTSSFRFIFSPSSLIFIRPSLRFLFFTSDSFMSIFSLSSLLLGPFFAFSFRNNVS